MRGRVPATDSLKATATNRSVIEELILAMFQSGSYANMVRDSTIKLNISSTLFTMKNLKQHTNFYQMKTLDWNACCSTQFRLRTDLNKACLGLFVSSFHRKNIYIRHVRTIGRENTTNNKRKPSFEETLLLIATALKAKKNRNNKKVQWIF